MADVGAKSVQHAQSIIWLKGMTVILDQAFV